MKKGVSLGMACILSVNSMYGEQASVNHSHEIAEIRAFVTNIEMTRERLQELGATYVSHYAFTDFIYAINTPHFNLDNEFIRLRVYEKTQWKQKKFCLVHKKRERVGISGKIVLYNEFDTLQEAQQHTVEYRAVCSMYRQGWEYSLNNMKIYVEDIQGLEPSVEIVAQDRKEIDDVLKQLPIERIVLHSVPYLVSEKNSNNIRKN